MIIHENGSARSGTRPPYDLIPREALDAIAERFAVGMERYGRDNWRKGGPEFFRDAVNHAIYHLLDFASGDSSEETPEQNLGAGLWNLVVVCWWERKGKKQWEESHKLPA